jgi:endonuclease YncB( thermonuclease family)
MNKLLKFFPLIAVGMLIFVAQTAGTKQANLSVQDSSNPDIPSDLKEYEVVANSIHDGDTLRVRSIELNTVLKIRFACIDAPEIKQPLGEESRNYLRSLVTRGGNKVRVQPITVDRYGRTVAQLWNNHGLLNSHIAGAGMAYGYEQYRKDCPNWPAIESMQSQAQSEKLGVWKLPNGGQRPWDYRKSNR